jgi:hypothetical protein
MTKVIKGAGNNKLIPITGLVMIKLFGKVFSLTTTTGESQLVVSVNDDSDESEFLVSVKADIFNSLVQKTTSEFIVMDLTEKGLEVRGNGTYMIEVPFDEESKIIEIPIINVGDTEKVINIDMKELKQSLSIHKPAVSDSAEVYCLTGYYFDETVITTNALVACSSNVNYFGKKVLISSAVVGLFEVFEDITIDFKFCSNNAFSINSGNVCLYGKFMDEVDTYPVVAIENLINTEMKSFVKVNKKEILQAVDRLNIFVEEYDKNAINILFDNGFITLNNAKNSSTETVAVKETNLKANKDSFKCTVDVELFKLQLNAYPEDIVEISFGSNRALKLKSEKRCQIIALLLDEVKK